MLPTNDTAEQMIHEIGSTSNQETPLTNHLNDSLPGVAIGLVAQAEQETQGPALQPEPAALHEQGEGVPALVSPHTPLLGPEHAAPAPSVLPAPALAPAPTLSVAPVPDVGLGVNPNPNPAQPTLMGSFHGIGGIQFAGEEPENLAAEVPAGQNVELMILPGHAMPNADAVPHAPFVQPFTPVQAMPAVAEVAQPFVPVANNNPAQQPLLSSLYGFEGIQFEGEDD